MEPVEIFFLIIVGLILFAGGFRLGYGARELKEAVKEVKLKAEALKKPEEPEEPQSILIDPYDEVATAKYELEKQMKKLNPDG